MEYKYMLASLTLLASCICVRTEFNPSCYRGYYFNREVLECTPCSTCKDDQVVRRNCFNDQDTLCGALSEFQFIRPQKLREAADDFQQNLHQTAQVPTTSTEIVLESDDKWFTITMVLVGFLVVTCATGVIIVLVTCVVCRRKDREIIYEPEYAAVCTLTKEDPPATKGTVIEQFKLVTERDS